ncbi:MAG TPA: disulfide oxidoreductase [Candidatus Saccharimonadia bacterium]|nr:disulfide oxidoreductase [Candidatus Saccharimonadia bacterium]
MNRLARNAHYLAWTIVALSVAMSLYFSDIRGFVPCNLCWYARILMYPLVVIIGVGILRRERHWVAYAVPLVGAGWLLELYHSLLQWGIVPETLARCIATVPCTTKYINYFGFITIPFLGLLAFTAIGVCLWLYHRANID